MEEDGNVVYELSCLASNIKKKLFRFWIFFSFLQKHEKIKAHNMFLKMLDPILKTFRLVSSFIGHEQQFEEYDKKLCFLCFLHVNIICIH
jgi:hypothetical protein